MKVKVFIVGMMLTTTAFDAIRDVKYMMPQKTSPWRGARRVVAWRA
jgi:hypothetical protein